MDLYGVDGSYDHVGSNTILKGDGTINSHGFLELIIYKTDYANPKRFFRGQITPTEVGLKLVCFSFSRMDGKANALQVLDAPVDHTLREDSDFSGKYAGKWNTLNCDAYFCGDIQKILSGMDISICEGGAGIDLNIYKK